MNANLVVILAILPFVMIGAASAVTDSGGPVIYDDYTHEHNTASHTSAKICGDHICKPGEKYNP